MTNSRTKISNLNELDLAPGSLDSELASFITSLIENNTELAEKLEHIDSLTELAEKMVIEAAKEVEAMKAAAERKASPVEVSQELCAKLDSNETEDTLCAEQEIGAKNGPSYYADFVDIVLSPPIALSGMLRLYRQLNKYHGVKVIAVEGSLDKGLWIRFIVRAPTPLLNVFEALTKVDRLSYAVIEVGKVYSAHKEPFWRPAVLAAAIKWRARSHSTDVCLNDGFSSTQ